MPVVKACMSKTCQFYPRRRETRFEDQRARRTDGVVCEKETACRSRNEWEEEQRQMGKIPPYPLQSPRQAKLTAYREYRPNPYRQQNGSQRTFRGLDDSIDGYRNKTYNHSLRRMIPKRHKPSLIPESHRDKGHQQSTSSHKLPPMVVQAYLRMCLARLSHRLLKLRLTTQDTRISQATSLSAPLPMSRLHQCRNRVRRLADLPILVDPNGPHLCRPDQYRTKKVTRPSVT